MSGATRSYLGQAWLVLVLSLVFGAVLAGVHAKLEPLVARNKLQDTLAQIPRLVQGAVTGERVEMKDRVVFRALDAEGRQVGWVVPGAGQGFADRIELLVGLDPEATRITGVYVLDQKETPGLGNKITDDDFLKRFQDRSAAQPLVLVKGAAKQPQEVEGITGATISSESVVSIINATVAAFRQLLREMQEAKP